MCRPTHRPWPWLGLSAGTLGELAAAQVQLLGCAVRAHPDGHRPAPPACEQLTRRVALDALEGPQAQAGSLRLSSVLARDVGAAIGDPELRQDHCAVALGRALALFVLVEAPLRP